MGAPVSIPVVQLDTVVHRVLVKHRLLDQDGTGAGGVVQVADEVVGLHATSPSTPYLSLHERIPGFASAELDDALFGRGDLVRLRAMRGTVFMFSRRLAPLAFAATRAATLASGRRWLARYDQAYSRLAPIVLDALAGRALTVPELRRTVGDDADVSGVVAKLCDEGGIVRGRPVGGRNSSLFRYRLWADAFPDVSLDEWDERDATRELVRLYLDSYGPVSRADLIWWTGLPARRIDDALHGLGEDCVVVSVEGLDDGMLITSEALELIATPEQGAVAINLLPMLDPFTMGYKDRRRFLDPAQSETVIDRGGNMTSVVLVNGRVAGVWDLAEDPNPAIRVLLFEPDHPNRATILDRAAETATFWFNGPVPVKEYTSMVPLRRRSGAMRRPLDEAQPRSATRPIKSTEGPGTGPTPIITPRRSPSRF